MEPELQEPRFDTQAPAPPGARSRGDRRARRWRIADRLRRDWPIHLLALATLVNGLLGVVPVLMVRFHEMPRLFNVVLPFGLHHWARSLTLLSGFMLAYMSIHLWQRRHVAWMLTVALCAVAVVAHVARGHLSYLAVSPGVTALLLIHFRGRFTVRSEMSSIVQGVILLFSGLLAALAYGTAGFWRLDQRDFGLNFHWADALLRTLREFALVGNSDLVARTRHAHWFLESLRLTGLAAAVFGAFSLFRPLAYRLRILPHERAQVREILQGHGRSSLDFFKLWPDKTYFFSPSRRACIAYAAGWGVAVSLGDPVGPESEIEGLCRDFLRFSADNGWGVAFHQVLPELLPLYRRLDLQVLKIGEEAVIDLERFATQTVERPDFRRVRRKLAEKGFNLARHLPPHSDALVDEAAEVSAEWLSLPGRRERGFTLGRFERGYVAETPLFVLRDAATRLVAFVNEIPGYPPGDATIDLMRHRVEIPNGAMDYLFAGLLLALRQEGFRRFSLGLAPLAGVGDRPGATLEERALHQLFEHLNRFFSYRGLRNYKAKFEPEWEERFLVHQGGAPGLVRVALALTRVTEG